MQQIWESLMAFHCNAASSLAYLVSTNWWFFLIIAGCICTAIMGWREKKETVIREEQNIL